MCYVVGCEGLEPTTYGLRDWMMWHIPLNVSN